MVESRTTVYLICGFICAGKTTFAKWLEERTGAVRITKDEWSIGLIGNDPTITGYAEHDRKVIDLSRRFAFDLASKGVNVILDEGFWAKEERLGLRADFERIGAEVEMIWVDTPLEVMRRRLDGRNEKPGEDSFLITQNLFDFYLPLWQEPHNEENVLRLSTLDLERIPTASSNGGSSREPHATE